MRLSDPDENLTHQVAYPHAVVGSSDPSWRERYWVSFQDVENKDTVLTLGLGQYPNQDVQEAFAAVATVERQRNIRLARALAPRNDRMQVGPLRIEVVRPYEELRFVLDENESGLAFDITWTSDLEPILEDRHFWLSRTRVTYDAIRYVQLGRGSGVLSSPDGEWRLTPETWWGERDHSWGTRPLPRLEGGPPLERPGWNFLIFCPFQLPDFGVHIYLYEAEPGRPVYLSAGIAGRRDEAGARAKIIGVEHDLQWVKGALAPTLAGGTITVSLDGGDKLDFELTALPGRAHLRGGGYEGWQGWYQGLWKGEQSLEHDSWDLTDRANIYRYAKAGSDHLFEVRHRDQVGYGIMQYIVLPGYARYEYAIPPRPAGTSSGP
jgi:hypothetical protein